MSRQLFDYLLDSVLFDDRYMVDDFSRLSARELESELQKYRSYVLNHLEELARGAHADRRGLQTTIPWWDTSDHVVRQMALYMDRVVLNDPLFQETYVQGEIAQGLKKLWSPSEASIDPVSVAKAARAMKQLTPAVATGFVLFFPFSLLEEPRELLLYHSKDAFATELGDMRELFHPRARVARLVRRDDYLAQDTDFLPPEDPRLAPAGSIAVAFDGHTENDVYLYHYVEAEVQEYDEESRTFSSFLVPKAIEGDLLHNWVVQSVNESALSVLGKAGHAASVAGKLNSMFMTDSELMFSALERGRGRSLSADLANLSLRLDIPVIDQVSLDTLMDLRSNFGQEFDSFRTTLRSSLAELREIDDLSRLKIRLENLERMLLEVQVPEVNRKVRGLIRNSLASAGATVGLCVTAFALGLPITAGLSLLFAGALNVYRDARGVRELPGYFLWKAQQRVH